MVLANSAAVEKSRHARMAGWGTGERTARGENRILQKLKSKRLKIENLKSAKEYSENRKRRKRKR
jgi:hypothetical protein